MEARRERSLQRSTLIKSTPFLSAQEPEAGATTSLGDWRLGASLPCSCGLELPFGALLLSVSVSPWCTMRPQALRALPASHRWDLSY